MNRIRLTSKGRSSGAAAELFPWQAVMMVMCLTAAGLFHEHPEAAKPLVGVMSLSHLRASVAPAAAASDLLGTMTPRGR